RDVFSQLLAESLEDALFVNSEAESGNEYLVPVRHHVDVADSGPRAIAIEREQVRRSKDSKAALFQIERQLVQQGVAPLGGVGQLGFNQLEHPRQQIHPQVEIRSNVDGLP